MGLDISHDAFSAAYSAFNRFRQAVCDAAGGGSFPPHSDESLVSDNLYWGEGYSPQTHPGLCEFFLHSDCDGEIAPEMAAKLADEMGLLLAALEEKGEGSGHIRSRYGGYGPMARKFIDGCCAAAAANEPLEFY